MTETPREPAPDGTSGTSFVDTSGLAERADIDETPASEGASSSHKNMSLSNADLPEPNLPPITSVVIDIGDDRVEVFHRDSVGSATLITPGAINWMTAGTGIVHSER